MTSKHADNVKLVSGVVQRMDPGKDKQGNEMMFLDVFNSPHLVALSERQYAKNPVLVGDTIEAWVVPELNLTEEFRIVSRA